MEQLVLLLIIAGISLINWLFEKSKKLREQKQFEQARARTDKTETTSDLPPALPVPPVTSQEEDSSDQMRRLLETMGIPTEFPREISTPEYSPPPEPEVAQTMLTRPPQLPPLQRLSIRKQPVATVSGSGQTGVWSRRLRSRTLQREAIVLREILGPPRAFSQP